MSAARHTEGMVTADEGPRRRGAVRSPARGLAVLLELTKVRLTLLVVATTATGFLVAPTSRPWPVLAWVLLGTLLAACGAMALNQAIEWRRDLRMERTRHRPVPAGTISPVRAGALGVGLALAGVALLTAMVNALTGGLAALVVVLYAGVYTPLKAVSPACTLVGAVCGAIPPLMGWSGATGSLSFGAWALAALLFAWQIPHFLALAWLYRDDYERGGFRMLPLVDPAGVATGAMATLYAAALIPVGLAPAVAGFAGAGYALAAAGLGLLLLLAAAAMARQRTSRAARRLFFATLVYLPLLLGALLTDRPHPRGESRTATASVLAAPGRATVDP